MALGLQQALQFSLFFLSISCPTEACVNDHSCPTPKSCCKGICRFSCSCTSSSDCDWNEKCCSDHQCVDSFEICPQSFPVYFVIIGACSMAFVTFLCFMLICYWARCCPWYKRRIARRRKNLKDDTLERSYFTTLSSTNMIKELHFPEASPPPKFHPPSYSPPMLGNPTKYLSFTVQRICQPSLCKPLTKWFAVHKMEIFSWCQEPITWCEF